jgi:MoaA/NifB/PqqE/SkfB family radical SAM enzyme
MAIKRIISTDFWTDRKIVENFSPEDKLFMVYILTNPHTTQIGIYPFIPKIAAFETGYNVDTINTLLERFSKKHKIIMVSNDTGEIAIKNYLKHSIVKGGKPVFDLLMKEAAKVKDKKLLAYIISANANNSNQTVREFIVKAKPLVNGVNDNDNDNDNEDSYHESYNESSKASKTKEIRHKHGEYNNVLLTDEQLQKLKNEFADWQQRIERLSEYMASTGKSYKNHLATIRAWARKELPKAQENHGLPPGYSAVLSD